jgi:hypothetical protein
MELQELLRQAHMARSAGSPFVAAVLEAGQRQLDHAPLTAAVIAEWHGDRSAAALAMRFNAALHALARRGATPELESLYRRQHQDFEGAIGAALIAHDAFIATWMRDTPQTNEVGRSAALLAALTVAHGRTGGLPFALFELGSSVGLNLNIAHYAYDLGGISIGDPDARVRIAPLWRGAPLPDARVELASAQGVDLHPIDPSDPESCERLTSYIWADEPARLDRLQQALAIARQHRPDVERANAASWLPDRLRAPQPDGLCRVVFHSMALQYLSQDDHRTVTTAILNAGARATSRRPLAWISFEWTPDRREVQLQLTCWPDGNTRLLATCHPYGAWIDWRG